MWDSATGFHFYTGPINTHTLCTGALTLAYINSGIGFEDNWVVCLREVCYAEEPHVADGINCIDPESLTLFY